MVSNRFPVVQRARVARGALPSLYSAAFYIRVTPNEKYLYVLESYFNNVCKH